jgi:hypothetical protein
MWRSHLMAEAYVYAPAATDSSEYNSLKSCHYNPEYAPYTLIPVNSIEQIFLLHEDFIATDHLEHGVHSTVESMHHVICTTS